MPWNAPKTNWTTGELVTSADLNKVGEDLAFLKSPPASLKTVSPSSNQTTSSTSFVDLTDATITGFSTSGGNVMVQFSGAFSAGVTEKVQLRFVFDGSITTSILASQTIAAGAVEMVNVFCPQSLSAGTHSVKVQWRSNGNTITAETVSVAAYLYMVESN